MLQSRSPDESQGDDGHGVQKLYAWQDRGPSVAAYSVALARAVHQVIDYPLIYVDPFSIAFIDHADLLRLTSNPGHRQTRLRHVRAYVVARSRFAEQGLDKAVRDGTTQYVIVGAGLDMAGHKAMLSQPDIRVYEVDHGSTQSWKRVKLHNAQVRARSPVSYVPLDLETGNLPSALESAGYAPTQATFFSWQGVVPYLSLHVVTDTLRYIASRPTGSAVAFDYLVHPDSLDGLESSAQRVLARRVARSGEPFRLFLEPATLAAILGDSGFTWWEDICMMEIDSRYFGSRVDGLCVERGFSRLVLARV